MKSVRNAFGTDFFIYIYFSNPLIMRNLYYLILFISLHAQSQFYEGFEGAVFPPPGWIVSDNGVGSTSWKSSAGTDLRPFEGTKAAFANRQNTSANTQEWLVSPAIAVTENQTLSFYSCQTLAGDQGAFFEVKISTVSQTDHDSFTSLETWSENFISQGAGFDKKMISLAAYVGKTIYIAFVRTYPEYSGSTDRWGLDSISVTNMNTIVGSVAFTYGTSCGVGAEFKSGVKLLVQNELGIHNVFTDDYGNYVFTGFQNSATISADLYNNNYFHVTPSSYSFNFTTSGNLGIANFCIKPQGNHADLEVVMLPNFMKPGYGNHYTFVYRNTGNQMLSGTVSVNYDANRMHIFGGYPQPYEMAGNTVSWDFTDLKPFETRTQQIGFSINSPTHPTFPVYDGDVLTFTSSIFPITGDDTPDNNVFTLQKQANSGTGSGTPLVPNDIMVAEGSLITLAQASDFLHYTIRFQNTGTSVAHKIVIRNALEDDLDPGTIEIIGASHTFKPALDSKTLEFTFDNIDLPPMANDDEASYGYVTYKIKPTTGVGIGSVIENNAEIYYDANFPVTTNTAVTTISALGTKGFASGKLLQVYPNPASDVLNVNSGTARIKSIAILNHLGQTVQVLQHVGQTNKIDVNALANGLYLIRVNTDSGEETQKFIKQ